MINLTQEERTKFAAWLRQEAKTALQLSEELGKLPGMTVGQKKYHIESWACNMIAERLENTETMTI